MNELLKVSRQLPSRKVLDFAMVSQKNEETNVMAFRYASSFRLVAIACQNLSKYIIESHHVSS